MNTETNALKKFYLMLAVVSPFFVQYTTLYNYFIVYTVFQPLGYVGGYQ